MAADLKPMLDGIFEVGPPPRLLGAECPICKQKFFPKPIVCPHCLEDVKEIKLNTEGTVYSYSILRIPNKLYQFPQPYASGYVDLDNDNIRVYCLFDPEKAEEIRIGQRVTLRVGQIGIGLDGKECLRYYFTPVDGGEK
ncbi:MAG: hypothetical protein GXZ07_10695 [Firmicutes bacterium]|nr:hypothetical protein [Bacillota bacterium]